MATPAYPPAPRSATVDDLFGHRVADPFRPLEDADAPATREWLAAQDRLARDHLDRLPGRDRLRDRLSTLLAAGLVTPPVWRGERAWFLRRSGDQEHAVLVVRDETGRERVLIDPAALDPAGTTTLDGWQPDREGRLLAYQLSHGGDEESVLAVLDVETGAPVDGPIDRTRYSPVGWLPGGTAYYYVRRLPPEQVPAAETAYHRRVWLHRVGTDPDDDIEIFGAGLAITNYYGVSVSRDGRWLLITASEGTAPRTDAWIADLADGRPEAPSLRPIQVGVDAHLAPHVGRDGRLYLLTDRDAPRGRLCVTDPRTPDYPTWRELVTEDPEGVLEDFAVLDGPELGDAAVLVAARTRHAVGELSVHALADGRPLGTLPRPGLGSIEGLSERPEGGHEAWFGYTDHVTPPTVFRYDARDGTVERFADPPGAVELVDVRAEQVTYQSADGTPVRMFLLGPTTASGPTPTVLYGYGGFGVSLTPGYSASILAWVEAGGRYAIANLRGGGEEGEEWHRAGMREHKLNVFADLEAAADWLVAHGHTSPEQLAISGGSNGGLLVGAALTRRPAAYAAVSCSAPLLDMVRYEQFGLGVTWNDEYGRADDPEELSWLLSYSPYHHVREGVGYPAVLFSIFDSDTRVDPMHARKMCAALQTATTSDRPILLRRERDVGHGARSVSRTVELAVDTLAFLARHTGLLS